MYQQPGHGFRIQRDFGFTRGRKVIHRTLSIYDYNWLPVYYIAVGEQNVV